MKRTLAQKQSYGNKAKSRQAEKVLQMVADGEKRVVAQSGWKEDRKKKGVPQRGRGYKKKKS